jgi:hypothetical protein
MLLSVLLAASLLPSQQASMQCIDAGSEIATAQTQPVPGPNGVMAVLKVSTADDHSKNSHLCNADYLLLFTPANGQAKAVLLLTSDGDWERTLSLRLDGYSRDGERVFGVIAESGKHRSAVLFDYNTADGTVRLIDLRKQFARVMGARCDTTFDAVGTTENGWIIVELNSALPCATDGRWQIGTDDSVHPLSHRTSVHSLFISSEGKSVDR